MMKCVRQFERPTLFECRRTRCVGQFFVSLFLCCFQFIACLNAAFSQVRRLSIMLRSYGAAGLSRASCFLKVLIRHFLDLPECIVLAGGGRLATLVRRSVCA